MSAFLHHVAGAALPVAVGLLILAAAARAALWARITEPLAQAYLEPLATWCLITVGVDVLAVAAAGDAAVLSFAAPLGVGAAAAALRTAPERPAVEPAPQPPAPAAPAPMAGALWAEPVEVKRPDEGLWSRP
jgi:hypothetical protein